MNEYIEAYRKKVALLEEVQGNAMRFLDIIEHMYSESMKDRKQYESDDLTYCSLMKRGIDEMPEDFEFACNQLRRSINAVIRDKKQHYATR